MVIEKKLGCKFIRIDPDTNNYEIFVEISKTHNHIIESTKTWLRNQLKKSFIDKISKTPLKLEFEENHSIKSKYLKFIFKRILPS